MRSTKLLLTWAALALAAALAMPATAAQAKHKHVTKHKPAATEADKSAKPEHTLSEWRRLDYRTNQNGDTLEVWTGHDRTTSHDTKKITDRFILVKRDKDGVPKEIALGKLPNRKHSKPVDFADLAARGVIVSTIILGADNEDLAARLASGERAANGKAKKPTPKQFAALNHLFNTIARSEAALKPDQTGAKPGELKKEKN